MALLAAGMGCGTDDAGVFRTEVNGQIYEARVVSTACFVENVVAGAAVSTLDCTVGFSSQNRFGDQLHFRINNIKTVYDSFMGVFVPYNLSVFDQWYVTLLGSPRSIDGGTVRVTALSNFPGDTVCADVELLLVQFGQINGNFCGVIQTRF